MSTTKLAGEAMDDKSLGAPRNPRRGLAWLVVIVLFAAFCWRAADTPLAIVLAALAPAGIYAGLLTLLDRREPEASVRIAAFLWGAVVAASAAATANGLLQGWMSTTS